MQLALDTSTTCSSFALVDGLDIVSEQNVGRSNPGDSLVAAIDAMLRESQVNRAQIDQILVGVGPGPYTSTRVGVAIARTLGFALEVDVVGVCSHDLIAAQVVAESHAESEFIVATDARRSEVYWAKYGANGRRVVGPSVGKPATVAELDEGVKAWFGNGLERYPAIIATHEIDVGEPNYPSARWTAVVVRNALAVGAVVPTTQPLLADHEGGATASIDAGSLLFAPYPLYLRRPDAVPSVKVVAR